MDMLVTLVTQHALPFATGALTLAVGITGYWQNLQARRREERTRLDGMADRAVRITESRYVRPLLRERMEDVLSRGQTDNHRGRLFCQLEARVALTPEEKRRALALACEALVDDLRADPDPPIPVVPGADDRLIEQAVEAAYHLRPRPAAQLIDRLGEFWVNKGRR